MINSSRYRGFAALLALAVVAAGPCPKPLSAAVPPKPVSTKFVVHSGHQAGPDTLVTMFTCSAPAPDTSCAVTYAAGGAAMIGPATMSIGQQTAVGVVCPAPGAHVTLNAAFVGIAPGVPNSTAANVSVTGDCPLAAAVQPVVTFTPFVVHKGSGGP